MTTELPATMRCRFCASVLPAPFLDLGPQPAAAETLDPGADEADDRLMPLRVAACTSCHLMQLAGPMAPGAGVDHGHGVAASSTLTEHERRWAEELADGLPIESRGIRVLDISSGGGTMLRDLEGAARHDAEIETLGFEADARIANTARDNGTTTITGRFDLVAAQRLAARGWLADLVVVNHALAHAEDLHDFAGAIMSGLAPDGRVAIETTDALGIVRDGLFDTVNHAHASYPTMASLVALLRTHGLEIEEARRVDVHGGSLRLVARHSRDDRASSPPSVRAAIADERAAGLDDARVLTAVGTHAQRVSARLYDYLASCRAEGRRVLGYGAPARGLILLNLARIDSALLPFTVDRSLAKQGRVLAGCRIPVQSPEALESSQPDAVLVLPWTLFGEISVQLGALSRTGTQLVVAMPELRVMAP